MCALALRRFAPPLYLLRNSSHDQGTFLWPHVEAKRSVLWIREVAFVRLKMTNVLMLTAFLVGISYGELDRVQCSKVGMRIVGWVGRLPNLATRTGLPANP